VNTSDFAHEEFSADNWESLVKDYINNLECHENQIWYKNEKQNKKISEELITLGYYARYKYSPNPKISFRLNQIEGEEDGWICKNREILESVQTVIAYYDKEEAEEDRKIMKGEDVVTQVEADDRVFLGEGHLGPEAALPGQQQGQHLEGSGPSAPHILMCPQAQLHPQPCCSAHWAKTPVPNSRSPSSSTSAPGGSQPATVPSSAFCSAKLDAPGPSGVHNRGKARPRHPTHTYRRLKLPHSVRSTVKCSRPVDGGVVRTGGKRERSFLLTSGWQRR
jgi:hypothetical protein